MPPARKSPLDFKGRLRRLDKSFYRDFSWIHWSTATKQRRTGWLTTETHLKMREILLHALLRYKVSCPAYCLMPDHGHFLWIGYDAGSRQDLANKLLRQEWNHLIGPDFSLQRQSYDHVLREHERERNAFPAIAYYIFENPVRAGLPSGGLIIPFLVRSSPGIPNSTRAPTTTGTDSGKY